MSAAGFALTADAGADRQVRKLAAEFGFCDPAFRGELATLFDGRGRSLRYLRPSGVNVDRFGELLWDRGITGRRLDTREVLDLLATAFDGTATRKAGKGRTRKAVALAGIDAEAAKAKRNRNRKFACAECGKTRCNGAVSTCDVLCAPCTRKFGFPVPLIRVDLTFDEVMTQTGAAEAVPF